MSNDAIETIAIELDRRNRRITLHHQHMMTRGGKLQAPIAGTSTVYSFNYTMHIFYLPAADLAQVIEDAASTLCEMLEVKPMHVEFKWYINYRTSAPTHLTDVIAQLLQSV